jgi:hypothetical protein
MTMPPRWRKAALTTHIVASVGMLGAIAAFLALAIGGLAADGELLVRATFIAMDWTTRLVVVPLGIAALLTGLIQALGTRWGLFRHYWVLAKLLLTAFALTVLLLKIELIGVGARLALEEVLPRAELQTVGMELMVHAAGGLLVLLLPAILSVYKPAGVTPWAREAREVR